MRDEIFNSLYGINYDPSRAHEVNLVVRHTVSLLDALQIMVL
jgi:hypothetical protein